MGSASTRPDWTRSPPSAFDVVTCYYPEDHPGPDGFKLRPALVLNVLKDRRNEDLFCEVAYGTTKLRLGRGFQRDLVLQNAAHRRKIGLPKATRFVLDLETILILPWTEDFFGCWRGHTSPRLGTLTEDYIKEFVYLMALRQRELRSRRPKQSSPREI